MRLARATITTLRQQGWYAVYRKLRQRLLPPKGLRAGWGQSYSADAFRLAAWHDFSTADVAHSRATMATNPGLLDIRSLTWFLPPFEHAYYGGIHTILRFAAGFAQRYQVRNTFAITGAGSQADAQHYQLRLGQAFPVLANAPVVFVPADAALSGVPTCDAIIATAWETAYAALRFNRTRRKFYFLQDFEPMFFPAGSTSAQAEATYRFGFYGLTNTIALQRDYERDYQGQAMWFNPCVDTNLFFPANQLGQWQPTQPATVFFYARPQYWRNGFELGTVALRELKRRMGAAVRIVTAGQAWRPADYDLASVVENLGLLSYQQTAELYRTCAAGLVLMFTRHPSYLPFELMASGSLVVTNINHNTTWLLHDGENCLLAEPSASSIADALERGLQDRGLHQRITANARKQIERDFADWGKPIAQIYAYMCSLQPSGDMPGTSDGHALAGQ